MDYVLDKQSHDGEQQRLERIRAPGNDLGCYEEHTQAAYGAKRHTQSVYAFMLLMEPSLSFKKSEVICGMVHMT
jgi:hypothetical protein